MNIYLLMEGSKTEPLVYQSWITHVAPHMSLVNRLSEIKSNNFYMISSEGYPRILTHSIKNTIDDINKTASIDALWIIVDTENSTINQRVEAIKNELDNNNLSRHIDIRLIIQKCCLETWGFGNDRIFPNNNIDPELQDYLNYYDIRVLDPEQMTCPEDYDGSIANYHLHYLRKILKMKRISYTKNRPNDLLKGYYFDEICARVKDTGHLSTFENLSDILLNLKDEANK